jgi:ATP-dependent protease ClpP protease subunit
MNCNPSRRRALLFVASAGIATVARAQTSPPVPPAPTPAIPPVTSPAAPAAAPPPAPIVPVTSIDKSKSYYLFFEGSIDVASMLALRRQLTNLTEAGVSEITLVIDSAGGQIEPILITYSFIRALPTKVNTHAQGFVQSAASVLFLAGQDRSADRNVRFVFHPSQLPVSGLMNGEQIHERASASEVVSDSLAQICRDRTSLPASEIAKFAREMVVYTAEQARGYGVVQAVSDLRIPGEGKAKIILLN